VNWIIEHLPAWNSWIALVTNWLPGALCAYGYLLRSIYKIRQDKAKRQEAESGEKLNAYYLPGITVGSLVGYFVLTITPIANLFAAIFDVAPGLFRRFFDWCARVLDVPLVPKRKKPGETR
jgi:hypothetical protein